MRAGPALGWITLLGATVFALVPRPSVDNSSIAISATRDLRAEVYDRFRAEFGADEVIAVYLESNRLPELTEAIETVEEELSSFAPVDRILGPGSGYPDEILIIGDEELFDEQTRQRIEGRLAGPLGRSLKLLQLDPPAAKIYAFGQLAKTEVWAEVEERLNELKVRFADSETKMTIGGSPLLNLALDREGRRVDDTAVPVLLGLFVVVLLATLRSIRTTICAFIPVGLGVLATDGIFSLLGGTGNLVVNVSKPLLFVLLLASGLHVIVAFQHRLRLGQTRSRAAWGAVRDKARGVALALLTTAIGFFSLAGAEIAPIQTLGLLASGGLALGGPLILFGLPTLLARLGPNGPPPAHGSSSFFNLDTVLRHTVAWSVRKHRLVFGATAAIMALSAWGLSQLSPSTHPVAYFPDHHPVRENYNALSSVGAGLMTLEALLTVGEALGDPPLVDIDNFASTATAIAGIRGRIDLALLVREASLRTSGSEKVPRPEAASWLFEQNPELSDSLRSGSQYRVALLLEPRTSAADLDRIAKRLHEIKKDTFSAADLTLTGNYDLVVRAQLSLQQTLIGSLAFTLLLMELVLLVALRSVRLALVAVIPNVLPVAVNGLVMWLLKIPLDVGTAMTGAVALGIAVDDTLHFLVAWREEGREAAVVRTGRAIVLSTAVIAVGFFSLVPSDFLPTRHFSLLAGVSMLVALLGDLVVLPPLLEWSGAQPATRPDRGELPGS